MDDDQRAPYQAIEAALLADVDREGWLARQQRSPLEAGKRLGRWLHETHRGLNRNGPLPLAHTLWAYGSACLAGELATVQGVVVRGVTQKWPGYRFDLMPEAVGDWLRRRGPAYEPLFFITNRPGLFAWLARPDLHSWNREVLTWLSPLWLRLNSHDEWLYWLDYPAEDAAALAQSARSFPPLAVGPGCLPWFGHSADPGFVVPWCWPTCDRFGSAVYPKPVAEELAAKLLIAAVPLPERSIVVLGTNDPRGTHLAEHWRKTGRPLTGRHRSALRRPWLPKAVVLHGRYRGWSWGQIGERLLGAGLILPENQPSRRNNLDRARNLWKEIPDAPRLPLPRKSQTSVR